MSKCSGVTPGGKDALLCLQKNVASLSPACQTAVSATIPCLGAGQASTGSTGCRGACCRDSCSARSGGSGGKRSAGFGRPPKNRRLRQRLRRRPPNLSMPPSP
jgi:hypothetical protein